MSPHRTFNDHDARLWNAWDVIPIWGERRSAERRRNSGTPVFTERRLGDRRVRREGIRIALPERLAHGWIAFESGEERRRLAPIPARWHELPDTELLLLWRHAERLPPRRRKLVE